MKSTSNEELARSLLRNRKHRSAGGTMSSDGYDNDDYEDNENEKRTASLKKGGLCMRAAGGVGKIRKDQYS